MNAKNRIKIVKREERSGLSGSGNEAKAVEVKGGAPAQNVTQKVSRQVAAWVKEFQQRRLQETGQSFASLFQRA
jgi:hypothetical protein